VQRSPRRRRRPRSSKRANADAVCERRRTVPATCSAAFRRALVFSSLDRAPVLPRVTKEIFEFEPLVFLFPSR
jgi:hypothetical protein